MFCSSPFLQLISSDPDNAISSTTDYIKELERKVQSRKEELEREAGQANFINNSKADSFGSEPTLLILQDSEKLVDDHLTMSGSMVDESNQLGPTLSETFTSEPSSRGEDFSERMSQMAEKSVSKIAEGCYVEMSETEQQVLGKDTSPIYALMTEGTGGKNKARPDGTHEPGRITKEGYEIDEVSTFTRLNEPILEPGEYIVPLPMQGSTAEQYRNIIPFYSGNIKRFVSKNRRFLASEEKRVRRLLEHLHNITYHVDLENERAFTQEKVGKKEQAKWDETCSMKFRVLGSVLEDLRFNHIHVVIAVRDGRPMAILEKWLRCRKFGFGKAGERTTFHEKDTHADVDPLHVTLISTEYDSSIERVRDVSVLIALDSTFNIRNERIKRLRSRSSLAGRLAPVLNFITYASQEHVLRCIPFFLPETEKLQILSIYIAQLQNVAGKLPSDVRELIDCPMLISDWLIRQSSGPTTDENGAATEAHWPLPQIGGIESNNSEMAQLLSSPATDNNPRSPSDNIKSPLKRPNVSSVTYYLHCNEYLTFCLKDVRDELESPKRMRLTPQPGTVHHDGFSIAGSTEANEVRAARDTYDGRPTGKSHRSVNNHPEPAKAERTSIEEQFVLAQEQIQDYVGISESLRQRCEDLLKDRKGVETELKDLRLSSGGAEKKVETLTKEIENERSINKSLLEQRETKMSDAPANRDTETQEFEENMRNLQVEADKLHEKLKRQDAELDFVRDRYREASDTAVKATEQVSALENQLQHAKRQASGEAARLKQMHISSYASHLERDIKSQRKLNHSLTDLLRRKDDEIRLLRSRSLINTRATSVPHSPRF